MKGVRTFYSEFENDLFLIQILMTFLYKSNSNLLCGTGTQFYHSEMVDFYWFGTQKVPDTQHLFFRKFLIPIIYVAACW
jgi:hypothetical protein